jgi:hypothetical protein
MFDKINNIKNQGKLLSDELILLIDEFIAQLDKNPIVSYQCGK